MILLLYPRTGTGVVYLRILCLKLGIDLQSNARLLSVIKYSGSRYTSVLDLVSGVKRASALICWNPRNNVSFPWPDIGEVVDLIIFVVTNFVALVITNSSIFAFDALLLLAAFAITLTFLVEAFACESV